MDRICNLYISDSHLSITLFEYIKKEIEKGTKVVVISQDSVENNIRKLSSKFKEYNKNEKVDILKEIEKHEIKNIDNTTVIIQGDNNFILKTEEYFSELLKTNNIKVNIVSCYNISNSSNVCDITRKYNKILNTSGVVDINNEVYCK